VTFSAYGFSAAATPISGDALLRLAEQVSHSAEATALYQ
jgi:hypothetical protein